MAVLDLVSINAELHHHSGYFCMPIHEYLTVQHCHMQEGASIQEWSIIHIAVQNSIYYPLAV